MTTAFFEACWRRSCRVTNLFVPEAIYDELNVRGLNAVAIWCSAGVGALAGIRLVARSAASAHERCAAYRFVAVPHDRQQAHGRALRLQALNRTDFQLRSIVNSFDGRAVSR